MLGTLVIWRIHWWAGLAREVHREALALSARAWTRAYGMEMKG